METFVETTQQMNMLKKYLNNKEGHEIRYECFECSLVHNVPLYIKGEMVARAFVIEPEDTDWYILFDIQIHDEENRGKGYGSEVLDFVKNRFERVQTGARNKRVGKFLLNNGFKIKKSLFKKQDDIYFFLKGMENADTSETDQVCCEEESQEAKTQEKEM